MEECCPNLTSIAGPLLGAELISIAGGLKSLAMMPGSRIQILGAGKAFFSQEKIHSQDLNTVLFSSTHMFIIQRKGVRMRGLLPAK
jgi:Protein implicated in ribosomal biogenesis, Nop56p homolog